MHRLAVIAVLAGLACFCAPVSVRAEPPASLRSAIDAQAAREIDAVVRVAVPLDGRTGELTLDAARGPCRSFVVRDGGRTLYAGAVCRASPLAGWTIRDIRSAEPEVAELARPERHDAVRDDEIARRAQPGPIQPAPPPVGRPEVAEPARTPPAGVALPRPAPTAAQAPAPGPVPPPHHDLAHAAAPAPTPDGAVAPDAVSGPTEKLPISYNKPDHLESAHDTVVSLVVESGDVRRAEAALAQLPGAVTHDTAALTSVVTARLTGDPDAVTIAARFPDTQTISHLGNVTWAWDVRAKRPGETTLSLEIFDNVDIEGKPTPVQLVAYTDRFKVVMDPVSWLTYEIGRIDLIYKFLGIGTPAAILVWLYTWWRARRAKKAEPSPRPRGRRVPAR